MSRSQLSDPLPTGPYPLRSFPRDVSLHPASPARLSKDPFGDKPALKTVSAALSDASDHEVPHLNEMERHPSSAGREIPFAHMRIHFADFARQLRLHRHHEHRKRMLSHQRDHLGKAVALSARLQRVGSWVHDGLVQISQQSDPSGFTRVHQHMQELVDLCQSQWLQEIHALDGTSSSKAPTKDSFLARLPDASRDDCLELIHTLRHQPRFLVERFRAMNPEQVKGLSTSPRFRTLSDSVLVSLSENRGRDSLRRRQKSFLRDSDDDAQLVRSRAYSKELEDYASSFERSNPLSFLIHNVYGPTRDIDSSESQLRFSTWSTVCANLFMESQPAFNAIISDVLSAFAHLYDWQIKERLEMFLMGSLQRGAFLYNSVYPSDGTGRSHVGVFESFSTPQAEAFFNAEVKELFQILGSGEGGIPMGALRLGRAIIDKLPDSDSQGAFRGHLFFGWFLPDFLRIAMSFPEVSAAIRYIDMFQLIATRTKACSCSFTSPIGQGPNSCISYGNEQLTGRTMR
jgi:hypothetical protein